MVARWYLRIALPACADPAAALRAPHHLPCRLHLLHLPHRRPLRAQGVGAAPRGAGHGAAAQQWRQQQLCGMPAADRCRRPLLSLRPQHNLLAGSKGSNSVDSGTFAAACVRDGLVAPSGDAFVCARGFDFEGREIADM